MNRESGLNELAKKIYKLEKEYQVSIISDNGYTNAVIVDQVTGHGYVYEKGKIEPDSLE
ncbi:hypothetical protein [Heyndrickxia oleronia]|uniref:hypothetical protein n=1 Tax=Heyndrickxia oleronia TaxID=38875 RepID=UPI001B0B9F8A|nr:hypothetical protein [Heyndrickxia oleronia]GIN38372.1 hypothetical protein J19TS1_13210 [Heyndrickxia oleronia]